MDLSAALHHFHNHHHQEMGSHSDSQSLDTMIACSKPTQAGQEQQQLDKKPRPPDSEAQKCPRCDSANTKFCYYNNYSLTQPRYFCKSCRRYWTKGGTLRNVPVGGGCRRNNKRSSSISSPSFSGNSSFIKRAHSQDIVGPAAPAPNPLFSHFGGGLGLGLGFGFDHHHHANVTDFDGFLGHPHGGGSFLINNSLHHHHQNHDQNLSYGFGTGNEEVAGGGGVMAPLEAVTVTAMKQDGCTDNNSKGIWGYHHQPWQMINNGDYHGNMGFGVLPNTDLDPIKETWNGLIGNSISNWQAGLLNAPALI